MKLAVLYCASILTARPGCTIEETRLVVDVIPAGCAAKAQEVVAELAPFHVGEIVTRYGCLRDRRGEAGAGQ